MNRKDKNNKSLCEISIEMVTNLVKLSSLSIAKMSLTLLSPLSPRTTERHKDSCLFHTDLNDPQRSISSLPWNRKSQKSRTSSKAISYLLEPLDEGNTDASTFVVVNEEESIDGKASEYIRKVHEKNGHNSHEISNIDTYTMPPPHL